MAVSRREAGRVGEASGAEPGGQGQHPCRLPRSSAFTPMDQVAPTSGQLRLRRIHDAFRDLEAHRTATAGEPP